MTLRTHSFPHVHAGRESLNAEVVAELCAAFCRDTGSDEKSTAVEKLRSHPQKLFSQCPLAFCFFGVEVCKWAAGVRGGSTLVGGHTSHTDSTLVDAPPSLVDTPRTLRDEENDVKGCLLDSRASCIFHTRKHKTRELLVYPTLESTRAQRIMSETKGWDGLTRVWECDVSGTCS